MARPNPFIRFHLLPWLQGGTHMESAIQVRPRKDDARFAGLDTFLLYLLATELGYFFILMLAAVVISILVYATDFSLDPILNEYLNQYASAFLWPVLVYIVALPLNIMGGIASLVLTIRTGHKGYPGSGHLLNWLFLLTTGWLFIVTMVVLLPMVASSY
jgi:hypothetical protein